MNLKPVQPKSEKLEDFVVRKVEKTPAFSIENNNLAILDNQKITEAVINTTCYVLDNKPDKKYVIDIYGDPQIKTGGTSIEKSLYPVANTLFKAVIALSQAELIQYMTMLKIPDLGASDQISAELALSIIPFSEAPEDREDFKKWKGWANVWYIFSTNIFSVIQGIADPSRVIGNHYMELRRVDPKDPSDTNYFWNDKVITREFLEDNLPSFAGYKNVVLETSLGKGYILYTGGQEDIKYRRVIHKKPVVSLSGFYLGGAPYNLHRCSVDNLSSLTLGTNKIADLTPAISDTTQGSPFAEGDFAIIGAPDYFKIQPARCGSTIQNVSRDECSLNTMPTEENPHGYLEIRQIRVECLSGDTRIRMANNKTQRLDSITVGDYVWTLDGNEKVIYSDAALHKQAKQYTEFILSDNTKLKVIKNHRFYNLEKNKFVHSSTLKIGDHLVTDKNKVVEIIDIKQYRQNIKHYTIITENLNRYSANGIITGNRASNIKWKWLRKLYLKLFIGIFGRN